MNDCHMLHETVVKDIVDVIDTVKDADEVEWLNAKNKTGSIARRASNLVLVFPVLASSSLSIQSASLISKAIERKCVSLLQLLFSSIQYHKGVENVDEYIKLFHTNLNAKMSIDDFISAMDKMSESGEITITDKDAYDMVMEDMRNINYHLDTDYGKYPSINEYMIRKNVGGSYQVIKEALSKKDRKHIDDDIAQLKQDVDASIKTSANVAAQNAVNSALSKSSKNQTDQLNFFKYQLVPQDVQKANELVPTLMAVNFNVAKDGNVIPMTGIVGVKAKLYPIDSMDIVNRISSKVSDKNGLFNLIRASTREISFFKDLAFAIDKAKVDAVNMASQSNNAKVFRLLERRAAKNRFSTLMKKNDASPITSLVISQDEVEYLKKYCNIDMEKSYVTKKLLEGYNLMDIVIVDEGLEIARFLYDDGDGAFETMTFDALSKESKDDGYKKVINLMSKIR